MSGSLNDVSKTAIPERANAIRQRERYLKARRKELNQVPGVFIVHTRRAW